MSPQPADNYVVRRFLETMFLDGRAELRSSDAPGDEELGEAVHFLVSEERRLRTSLAYAPPEPEPVALRWGALMTYRAAQFLAYRDLPAEAIAQELGATCPGARTPAVCYSVDVSFRFLPDLMRLARAASREDPLHEQLTAWCREWPLSSVGVSGIEAGVVEDFIEHPSLRMLYVDRIIAAGDVSRLSDARVATAIRAALGEFPDLAPQLAAELQKPAKEQA